MNWVTLKQSSILKGDRNAGYTLLVKHMRLNSVSEQFNVLTINTHSYDCVCADKGANSPVRLRKGTRFVTDRRCQGQNKRGSNKKHTGNYNKPSLLGSQRL